jgi:hypothetical protein
MLVMVLLDGAFGHHKSLRDPGVRQPLGYERENLALARRELIMRGDVGATLRTPIEPTSVSSFGDAATQ